MYYIKYVVIKPLYCPKCGKDVLHECGNLLHQSDEESRMVKILSVHRCLHCNKVSDSQYHPVEVDYKVI